MVTQELSQRIHLPIDAYNLGSEPSIRRAGAVYGFSDGTVSHRIAGKPTATSLSDNVAHKRTDFYGGWTS